MCVCVCKTFSECVCVRACGVCVRRCVRVCVGERESMCVCMCVCDTTEFNQCQVDIYR
jgi:hypothetical protein